MFCGCRFKIFSFRCSTHDETLSSPPRSIRATNVNPLVQKALSKFTCRVPFLKLSIGSGEMLARQISLPNGPLFLIHWYSCWNMSHFVSFEAVTLTQANCAPPRPAREALDVLRNHLAGWQAFLLTSGKVGYDIERSQSRPGTQEWAQECPMSLSFQTQLHKTVAQWVPSGHLPVLILQRYRPHRQECPCHVACTCLRQ